MGVNLAEYLCFPFILGEITFLMTEYGYISEISQTSDIIS